MTDPRSYRAVCGSCKQTFPYRSQTPPEHCGMSMCRARIEWDQSMWDGRARMAYARKLAGLPLDELDTEALERETF